MLCSGTSPGGCGMSCWDGAPSVGMRHGASTWRGARGPPGSVATWCITPFATPAAAPGGFPCGRSRLPARDGHNQCDGREESRSGKTLAPRVGARAGAVAYSGSAFIPPPSPPRLLSSAPLRGLHPHQWQLPAPLGDGGPVGRRPLSPRGLSQRFETLWMKGLRAQREHPTPPRPPPRPLPRAPRSPGPLELRAGMI